MRGVGRGLVCQSCSAGGSMEGLSLRVLVCSSVLERWFTAPEVDSAAQSLSVGKTVSVSRRRAAAQQSVVKLWHSRSQLAKAWVAAGLGRRRSSNQCDSASRGHLQDRGHADSSGNRLMRHPPASLRRVPTARLQRRGGDWRLPACLHIRSVSIAWRAKCRHVSEKCAPAHRTHWVGGIHMDLRQFQDCKYFLQGACLNGASCPFAHDEVSA